MVSSLTFCFAAQGFNWCVSEFDWEECKVACKVTNQCEFAIKCQMISVRLPTTLTA